MGKLTVLFILTEMCILKTVLSQCTSAVGTCPYSNMPVNTLQLPSGLPNYTVQKLKIVRRMQENIAPLMNNLIAAARMLSQFMPTGIAIRNVPIVNNVPVGAMRIASGIPIAKNAQINNFPVVNSLPAMLNSAPNIQFANNLPIGSNYLRLQRNLASLSLNNPLATLPINTPTNVLRGPLMNIPNLSLGSIPSLPLGNILNQQYSTIPNLPFGNFPNQPMSYVPRLPISNIPNLPVGYIPNKPVGSLPYDFSTNLATNAFNRVKVSAPLVPFNSIASLPAYNGLPVIKMSETIYKVNPFGQLGPTIL